MERELLTPLTPCTNQNKPEAEHLAPDMGASAF